MVSEQGTKQKLLPFWFYLLCLVTFQEFFQESFFYLHSSRLFVYHKGGVVYNVLSTSTTQCVKHAQVLFYAVYLWGRGITVVEPANSYRTMTPTVIEAYIYGNEEFMSWILFKFLKGNNSFTHCFCETSNVSKQAMKALKRKNFLPFCNISYWYFAPFSSNLIIYSLPRYLD